MAKRYRPSKQVTAKRAAGTRASKGHLAARIVTILAIVVVLALLVTVVGGFIYYRSVKLPDPNKDFTSETTTLYYRDGTTKLGELSVQNRTVVDYSKISENMKNAAIAAEDRTFWTNRGISPRGIGRSLVAIARGEDLQGGSTITQQYIKIRYLTSDQTVTRKLHELALAVKISTELSKEEILAGYLNTVYFGRGAYGVERAAEVFFNTTADKLTVPQAALLASMINNPSGLDPANGDAAKQALVERYDYVLDGMAQAGTISQADHDASYDKLPDLVAGTQSNTYGGPNGFLISMVVKELKDNGLTDAQINGGGLKVITTFDPTMQAAAIKTAQDYTAKTIESARTSQDPKSLHAAIASVAVGTGEVYALYGGPDYVTSQLNWGTTARPAASTFKAWALIAGLEQGYGLNTTLTGNTFTPKGDNVPVHNDGDVNYGRVSLLRATSYSMNTAFTDLVTRMNNGPAAVVKAANDAGVPTSDGWDLNNRIALGTAQVSPLSNATGFATIANDGQRNTTHVVKEVRDATDKVIYQGKTDATAAIDPTIARNAQTALESVVTSGTGRSAQALNREVIAKTGTKDVGEQTTAAWFVGATKQISTAVMYVAGDGNQDLNPYSASGDFDSSTYPADTWLDYMETVMQGLPKESFSGLNTVKSSASSDEQAADDEASAAAPRTSVRAQNLPTSVPIRPTAFTPAPAPSTPAARQTPADQPVQTPQASAQTEQPADGEGAQNQQARTAPLAPQR
ncbi:Membrane carboxypeptidase (penicillin-binding protein) [Propionibacterium cyclohexanicum]|uniref:Membrane carboxypeptidase (Penicillin-binding protein) n=1 Tax=Propionibacterium cyclohexanicum TaxID=64702 RepID=A0A1H9TQ89_9ACTN|nr:transglycosylase domain-containing protein [Propionibacterium cyclohexanicum]SER99332.1 Membrane carboxypeptidase (penicillin-binding protein) [Propionibacterium cyclohexanicum]